MSKLLENAIVKSMPELKGSVKEAPDKKKRFELDLTDGKMLKFERTSGISGRDGLQNVIKSIGATVVRSTKASQDEIYNNCGWLIKWNDLHYVVLLKADAQEKPRKSFSPDGLSLNGRTYNKSELKQFRTDILNAIKQKCGKDKKLYNELVSLIENVENKSTILSSFFDRSQKQRNKIICDFGEVLCPYSDLYSEKGNVIKFAPNSNTPVWDHLLDEKVRSVKGPGGGGKLVLTPYDIKDKSDVGQLLRSMSLHDRELYFSSSSKICPWIESIAQLVGGTTVQSLENFIRKNGSFDEFYSMISQDPFPGVGIPKTRFAANWRRRWEKEFSLDPIWFSIITVMTFWGQTDLNTIKKITKIVNPLFSTEKFVNIRVESSNIAMDEVSFVDVKQWELHYHSNAGGAWANWPSIRVKES